MTRPLVFFIALLCCAAAGVVSAAPPQPGLDFLKTAKPVVRAKLVADSDPVAPGQTFRLGVLYELDPGWHIYWENPGDAGFPTEISLKTPEGFRLGSLQWPAPHRSVAPGDIVTYGYEKSVLLWMEASVPADAALGSTVEIAGKTDWLECDPHKCVPGKNHQLSLKLSVAEKAVPSPHAARFDEAAAKTPRPVDLAAEDSPLRASLETVDGKTFFVLRSGPILPVAQPALEAGGHALTFFSRGGPTLLAPQATLEEGGGFMVRLPLASSSKAGEAISGVLTVPDASGAKPGLAVLDVNFSMVAAQKLATEGASSPSNAAKQGTAGAAASSAAGVTLRQDFVSQGLGSAANQNLFIMLIVAFLGGLILNIMPCVLPVISLKILGLVRQGGEDPKRIFKLGLVFALGVWASFMALAIPLAIARAAGERAGWGLIFQNADFNLGLYVFLIIFGLSLMGIFEMPIPGFAQSAAAGAHRKEGYGAAFLNGCLAVLLATPCMGPFIGPAVGVALTQSVGAIPLFFTAIALGLASPYIILSAKPAWTKFLPKPGEWMVNVKLLMGFAMMSAAIFPFHVLASKHGKLLTEAFKNKDLEDPVSAFPTMLALFGATLALATIIAGKFVTLATPRGRRWGLRATGLALAAAGYWLFLATPMWSLRTGQLPDSIRWVDFSSEELEEHLEKGKSVFIDFTADWCLSCKVNEATFIDTPQVRDILSRGKVVPMKADWTNQDDSITEMLAKFGRAGVPFYVVFPASDPQNPIVLPDAITTGILVKALRKAVGDA
jgi:thiol:disulfide interchange protein/DsbC/DsbD-like thiol-disulfide interchange protein